MGKWYRELVAGGCHLIGVIAGKCISSQRRSGKRCRETVKRSNCCEEFPSVWGVADFVLAVKYLGNRNNKKRIVLALVSSIFKNLGLVPLIISVLGLMVTENICEPGAGRCHKY